ncbi:MAG TPA: right-handed parallel beta-helix repeat-containing protein, partial [Kofleriaceae bacterium]|nr:right-handed parallel beta-helix repeat-containing protein [Kofleriaceae bacterium]
MSELKHGVSRRSIASWLGVASTAALVGCAARAEGEPTAVTTAADTVAGALTTIADLRDHAPLATESYAIVQGYYQAGDGGGGVFWWNPSTTAADNGGTVIAVAGVATGRWCRALGEPGVLDLAWFGARASAGSGAVNKAALINALTVIAGWGRGTLQLALLYPLGDDSDASWLGVGVGVASADGGALSAPVHHLTIAATVDGAGFQFARATAAHTNAGLKFAGCTGLTLRGLTLDGGGQGLELVYLLGCRGATIERCTFQNAITSFSLETTGGVDARIEGNHFAAGGGAKIGYISTVGAHEEGAHVVGNRFVTTGEMPGNRRAAVYAAIRNGVIANNSFEAAAAGVILLSDGLASEVCHALTVTGNCFLGCDFGVRGDPTTSQGPAQPLTAIAI